MTPQQPPEWDWGLKSIKFPPSVRIEPGVDPLMSAFEGVGCPLKGQYHGAL